MNPIQFAHLFVESVKKSGYKAHLEAHLVQDSSMWTDSIRVCIGDNEYCPLTFVSQVEKNVTFALSEFVQAGRLFGLSLEECSDIAAAADNDRSHNPELRKIMLTAME